MAPRKTLAVFVGLSLMAALIGWSCGDDSDSAGSSSSSYEEREMGVMEVDPWGTFTTSTSDSRGVEVTLMEDSWEYYPHGLELVAWSGEEEHVKFDISFDTAWPLEGEYSMDSSEERIFKNEIHATVDEGPHRSVDGTLTITEVTEETIEGEFEATVLDFDAVDPEDESTEHAEREISGTFESEWRITCAMGLEGSENEDGNYQSYIHDRNDETEFCQEHTKENLLGSE